MPLHVGTPHNVRSNRRPKHEDVRFEQYFFLKTALGITSNRRRALAPGMLLWGLPNTGKSLTLDKCLKGSRIRYQIYIDCIEVICGWKVLLQSIIRQLLEQTGQLEESKKLKNFEGLHAFIEQVQGLTRTVLQNEPVAIVVDHADILRDGNDNILQLLLRLSEFTEHNFCSILVSHVPWRCYSHVTDCPTPPFQIHFPQYTSSEIGQIILNQPLASVNLIAFEFYVTMVIQTYFQSTRDLKVLWKLVGKRQKEFLENFDDPTAEPSGQQLNNVWGKKCKPLLKEDFSQFKKGGIKFDVAKTTGKAENMPYALACLIFSAFIASVNPASSDRHLFAKGKSGGRPKRSEVSVRTGKTGIPHSRIVAIFAHLSESKCLQDTCLISTIEDLCDMGFLSRVGSDSLDEAKYRVHVSVDLAEELSVIFHRSLDEVCMSRR